MQTIFSIAIDGPAGAGKSTVVKAVAKELGALSLDTGAMYRAMGLYMHQHGISGTQNITAAVNEPQIEVSFVDGKQHIHLDGVDVTEQLRSPEMSMMASKVSSIPAVRHRMVALQREFAKDHCVVMDGRDIGTDVLPNATLKIFLTASCEVRAQRRFQELHAKNSEITYDDVLNDILQRDYNDAHREVSPMRQAKDAIAIDTSNMSTEQVIETILEKARAAIGG